jgi:PAS domain S-box-containing protein/putative nucleotidyltransferase with HDIG domain
MSYRKGQAESQTPQQRIEHLYAVLLAIRNVNQLIIREKDPDALVEQACNLLVETRGYYSAWIALLDGEGTVRTVAESGLGEAFQPVAERLKRGEFTACARRALAEPGVWVTQDPLVECVDCSMSQSHAYEGMSGMTVRLAHGGRTYGLMNVSIPAKYAHDDEEVELLVEVADDFSYTLHNLAVEGQRDRAVESLRDSEEKFRSLFEQSMDAIYIHEPDGKHIIANQAWLDLFGYTRDEVPELDSRLDVYAEAQDRDDFFRRIAATGFLESEVRFKKKDGTVMDCVRSVVALKDDGGNVVAYQGVIHDITERKKREREKVQRQKELECLYEVATAAGKRERGLDSFLRTVTAALLSALQYPSVASARLVLDGQEYLSDGYREGQWKESAAILVGGEVRGLVEVTYSERISEEDETPFLQEERTLLAAVAERVGITVERARGEEQLLGVNAQLERALRGTIEVIQQMVEARDPYTSGHQRRVSELSVAISRQMGLPEESCVSLIRTAALVHDIGKMVVPAEILSKPSKLTSSEFELIKSHAQIGHDILDRAELPDPVPDVVLQHHERLDGSGYPQGLLGDEILPEAQILAVADVVEAMSSHRPYRPALGIEAALEELKAGSGTRYYPDVAQACLAVFREGFTFSS